MSIPSTPSEIENKGQFVDYLKAHELGENNENLIRTYARVASCGRTALQSLEEDINTNHCLQDYCPERAEEYKTLEDKFIKLREEIFEKNIDLTPTKEQFLNSLITGERVNFLFQKQALNYALEEGEKMEKYDFTLFSFIEDVDDEVKLLPQKCPNIREISLHQSTFEGYRPRDLSFVCEFKKLEKLKLHGFSFNRDFFQKLSKLKNLKELDLSFCYVSSADVETLLSLENLETLTLQVKVGGYGGYGAALTITVFDHLKKFPKLKKLDIRGHKLSQEAEEAIKKFKNQRPDVEVLPSNEEHNPALGWTGQLILQVRRWLGGE